MGFLAAKANGALSVLVVDDEPDLTEVITQMFLMDGHAAASATCGPDALDLARANQYDLVLSDYRMPGINGTDLLHALRGEIKYRFWFALMTVLTEPEARSLCPDADAYLRKPFTRQALATLVERCKTALRAHHNGSAAPT